MSLEGNITNTGLDCSKSSEGDKNKEYQEKHFLITRDPNEINKVILNLRKHLTKKVSFEFIGRVDYTHRPKDIGILTHEFDFTVGKDLLLLESSKGGVRSSVNQYLDNLINGKYSKIKVDVLN